MVSDTESAFVLTFNHTCYCDEYDSVVDGTTLRQTAACGLDTDSGTFDGR